MKDLSFMQISFFRIFNEAQFSGAYPRTGNWKPNFLTNEVSNYPDSEAYRDWVNSPPLAAKSKTN
ncbi:MAG: hypothetical protein JW973_08555, partial [Bacteroidales bacterium]|nr:hypothetical protein [Bacteroidales bacterium]